MKHVAALLSPLLLVTGLVGCASSKFAAGSDGGDTADWVDNVCARMIALDHEVAADRTDLDAQLSAATGPQALLSSLGDFLAGVSGFVNLAGDDIDRLGVPALDGDAPSRLHRDIGTLFKLVDSETADLEARVKRAALDSGTMIEQANSLIVDAGKITDVDAEMHSILTDYRQLKIAFEEASSCERWVAQLEGPVTTAPSTTTTVPPTTTTTSPTTTTTPPTTTTTTTTPPTTEAPTTVPVTIDPYVSAREQYQAAADEYNAKRDLLWATYYGEDDFLLFRDAPAYCTEYAGLEREWNGRMSAIAWPADAQDEANIHITEGDILIGMLDLCAASPGTRAGVDAILTDIEAEEDTYFVTVDSLRVAIGLPSLAG